MGWASYFEHIRDRKSEATENSLDAVIDVPAGRRRRIGRSNRPGYGHTEETWRRATTTPRKQKIDVRDQEQRRLKLPSINKYDIEREIARIQAKNKPKLSTLERYLQILDEINVKANQERWFELSDEMDQLENRIHSFKASTMFAGAQSALDEAGRLSQQIDDILTRGNLVVCYLDTVAGELLTELDRIEARLLNKQSIAPWRQELQRQAVWLLHGWKALKCQIEEFQLRSEELQINLAGDVLDRIVMQSRFTDNDKE